MANRRTVEKACEFHTLEGSLDSGRPPLYKAFNLLGLSFELAMEIRQIL